jgi:hypothetical protein
MEPVAPPVDPQIFSHIRVVMGMVISLSMARLLTGLALFVQHPGKTKSTGRISAGCSSCSSS